MVVGQSSGTLADGVLLQLTWDLNLDGHSDLALANLSDGTTYEVDVWIYWGSESGLDLDTPSSLPAHAANAIATHPLEDGF